MASYGSQSTLLFGNYVITSSCGVQQGDPLGPLLFALAVKHISHSAVCRFTVWYLDDATIGGTTESVITEINRIKNAASLGGLELNTAKCEIISESTDFSEKIRDIL